MKEDVADVTSCSHGAETTLAWTEATYRKWTQGGDLLVFTEHAPPYKHLFLTPSIFLMSTSPVASCKRWQALAKFMRSRVLEMLDNVCCPQLGLFSICGWEWSRPQRENGPRTMGLLHLYVHHMKRRLHLTLYFMLWGRLSMRTEFTSTLGFYDDEQVQLYTTLNSLHMIWNTSRWSTFLVCLS